MVKQAAENTVPWYYDCFITVFMTVSHILATCCTVPWYSFMRSYSLQVVATRATGLEAESCETVYYRTNYRHKQEKFNTSE